MSSIYPITVKEYNKLLKKFDKEKDPKKKAYLKDKISLYQSSYPR